MPTTAAIAAIGPNAAVIGANFAERPAPILAKIDPVVLNIPFEIAPPINLSGFPISCDATIVPNSVITVLNPVETTASMLAFSPKYSFSVADKSLSIPPVAVFTPDIKESIKPPNLPPLCA